MRLRPAFACALLALGLANPAQGQPTEAQLSALKSSCRSDYMTKCMSVKPGGKEAFQCLKKNEASLSAACRNAVNAISAAAAPAQGEKQETKQEAKPTAPAQPAAAASAVATPAPQAPAPAAASPAPVAQPATTPSAPQHKPTATAPRPQKAAVAPPAAAVAPAAAPVATPTAPTQPTAAQQNAIKQNCRNDFMSHCSRVQPGGAQALSCLQANASKLSPACRSAVAAIGGAGTARPTAAQTQKPTVAPPAATAAPAETAPAAMPAPRLDSPLEARLIRRFCFNDFKVLCRGVPLGQGRALQCLAANAPALSPGCKAAMAQASR